MLQFNVLGPLDIKRNGESVLDIRGPKVRQLLALLILRQGTMVSHSAIIDELWGKQPPKTALSTVRTHVYHLRKLLKNASGCADLIDTRATGYMLRPTAQRRDAERFETLAKQAEHRLRSGDLSEASRLLSMCLDMWRGDPLADVTHGPVLTQHVQHLEESRIRVLQQRISVDMRLGRHASLTAELRSLVLVHPLNEWLHGQLIISLFRSGRRGDALMAYKTMREILREELGMDPSAPLQKLQQMILVGAASEVPHDAALIGDPAALQQLPQAS